MKARALFAITITVTCSLVNPAAQAVVLPIAALTQSAFSTKPKIIKFAIRNDSKASVELKVGEQLVTLRSGQTINVSVPVGAQVIRTQAIENHPAGELVVTVGDFLGDATVVVNT